jgi:hypothetical protein
MRALSQLGPMILALLVAAHMILHISTAPWASS